MVLVDHEPRNFRPRAAGRSNGYQRGEHHVPVAHWLVHAVSLLTRARRGRRAQRAGVANEDGQAPEAKGSAQEARQGLRIDLEAWQTDARLARVCPA